MDVFPVYYFPPISWFSAAKQAKKLVLEVHQHYRKQNYYNRMRIQGPNAVQMLSFPVKRTGENTAIKDAVIGYSEDWQKNHFKSLETAYRSSPYFEYYEDRLMPVFEKKWEKLIDLNLFILEQMNDILKLELQWELSDKFRDPSDYERDFRNAFDATGKTNTEGFHAEPYTQVFRQFEPDLSIFDLICNLGPEASALLK